MVKSNNITVTKRVQITNLSLLQQSISNTERLTEKIWDVKYGINQNKGNIREKCGYCKMTKHDYNDY